VVVDELVDRLNANPAFTEIYAALPTTTKSSITTGTFHAFLKRQGFAGFKEFKRAKTGEVRWKNRTYGGAPTRAKGQGPTNHKVISVVFEGYEDVYNLDVAEYHNFAITGGVFVHNSGKLDLKFNPLSQDEDFFVPVRKGVQQTKIEVVGSPAWQHMEDVEYFKDKLFAALKIPKVYLGAEAPRAKGSLSQQDVRFARSVLRLQRELRNGLKKIARVHLAALGIDPSRVEYEIYMTPPSSIFELAQLEVRNAKADFAGRMNQFVSMHWILQKVFGMSDTEIEYIIKQRHEEQLADAEVQAKAMGLQLDTQGKAQMQQAAVQGQLQLQQQAQAAQLQPPQAAGGKQEGAASDDLRKHLRDSNAMSQIWPLMRQPGRYKSITEQELFSGNREHEKKMEEQLEQLMEGNTGLGKKLNELRELMSDLKMTMPRH